MSKLVKIAGTDELAPGTGKVVQAEGQTIALFNVAGSHKTPIPTRPRTAPSARKTTFAPSSGPARTRGSCSPLAVYSAFFPRPNPTSSAITGPTQACFGCPARIAIVGN